MEGTVPAGIMAFISSDELVPAPREYGKGTTAIPSIGLGMAAMGASLLLVWR